MRDNQQWWRSRIRKEGFSTNNPPVGPSRFLTFGELPTDHYLWLVGEATRRVGGELPFKPELPIRKFMGSNSEQ